MINNMNPEKDIFFSDGKEPAFPQKKEWFSEWFNSPYYHMLYKNRDQQEAQFFIDNLLQHLNLNGNSTIMDLGCGKGRHAIYLNSKGFQVTGLDIAPESIGSAQTSENDRLHFYVHDMRQPFCENEFGCVLNLFTSFGYFETDTEDLQVMHAVRQMLQTNGLLVIDFMNTHKVIKNLVPYEIKEVAGVHFEITRKVNNGFIVKDIYFSDQGLTFRFQERVKAITPENFLHYFIQADMELLNMFGDYALNPYQASTSERLILIAKKR